MSELGTELSKQEAAEALQHYSAFLLTLRSDLDIAKEGLEKHQHDLGAITAFIKDIEDIQQVSFILTFPVLL